MRGRDTISVDSLRVECLVGVRPEERTRMQTLEVDLHLGMDVTEAGRSGKIAATCDYDRVAEEVSALLRFRGYRLLEMAAEELAAMLLGVHEGLTEVEVKLRKPRALEGRARHAGVSIRRDRHDFPRGHEDAEFGRVEVLLETKEAGLYLLHVAPGNAILPHFHRVMRELEWLVQGDLERDGRRLRGIDPVVWPRERVHTYANVGTDQATLFCCDMPPFFEHDEVQVKGDSR